MYIFNNKNLTLVLSQVLTVKPFTLCRPLTLSLAAGI